MSDDGDKTEEPSQKKIDEARKKGQVAVSRDLGSGVVFIVIFVAVAMTAAKWNAGLIGYFKTSIGLATQPDSVTPALVRGLMAMLDACIVPLCAGFITAIAIGFMQTGGLFATEALMPDIEKLMPNFKKFISINLLVEVVKGFVKVTLAAAAAYVAIKPMIGALANLTGQSPTNIMVLVGYGLEQVGNKIIIVVAIVGFGDYMWQRHSHMKKLRMSRQEQKDEYKQSEGDPEHKAERKRLHKEIMETRMVNEVKKANFVVVNPTHIAVAIKYDKDNDAAPTVLAKGELLLAERIKQVAREAGIPIFRDVSLARALKDVEEGDEIPEALYEAVAEILRQIYGDQAPQQAAAQPGQPGQPVPPGQPPPAAAPAQPPARAITSDAPRGTWRRA